MSEALSTNLGKVHLAKALEVDPGFLMRLALDQATRATAAKAWIDFNREISCGYDP